MSRPRRLIALSFDDGPSKWTGPILDLLADHGALATFFVLGANIAGHKNVLRRAVEEGHELGLHGWSHHRLTELSDDEIRAEMLATAEAIERAAGVRARFWRPPYFQTDERVRLALLDTDLIEVGYTIAPEDFRWSAKRTAGYVIERLHEGAIIDLHDGRPEHSQSESTRRATVKALELILTELDRRRFRSVTVCGLPGFRA